MYPRSIEIKVVEESSDFNPGEQEKSTTKLHSVKKLKQHLRIYY